VNILEAGLMLRTEVKGYITRLKGEGREDEEAGPQEFQIYAGMDKRLSR
jgi:hypothetical protein